MATSQLISAAQVVEPVSVLAGNTTVVDSFNINTTRTVKWIITVNNNPFTACQSSEILAVHDGSSVLYTEYAIIGGPIGYDIEVVLSGELMNIQITNNTGQTLTVSGASIETRI